MLLEALVDQLNQRFVHEKRATVCLWFDEHREFWRLLPHLREHLALLESAPFVLLEYDAAALHGQIWLKSQVARALASSDQDASPRRRFVVYVPFSEERLERPGADGEPPLELLTEYAVGGVLWRVGGKRPTLFTFLKQAGVALPFDSAAQRRLYDGGADSMLAKYVASNIGQHQSFWQTPITAELAQSRLVGDLDQALLDLAADPDGGWQDLLERGLINELQEMAQERYGFVKRMTPVVEWVRDLVAALALTDAYVGYGEAADFPFLDRLPPSALRSHHIQLLQRWLRDSDSRDSWDRWVREVEKQIDLSAWASGREGCAFGFPHLVRLRWNRASAEFNAAADKASTTAEYFEQNRELIAREAELGAASHAPAGCWGLLRDLGVFLDECDKAAARVFEGQPAAELARVYVEAAPVVELQHMRIRLQAEEQDLPPVARVADRAYGRYTNALNTEFFRALVDQGSATVTEMPSVTRHVEKTVWRAEGKRAVIIVDALRFDCAHAIKEQLHDREVKIEPVVATLPTVTPIGMTALLPISDATVTLSIVGNDLHPKVDGKDTAVLSNRISLLSERGATCLEIAEVETASQVPADAGDLLVAYGHDELDHIGHGEAQTLIRHVQSEVDRLVRLIQKLHRWGYPTVHVLTDHGFILLPQELLPETVPCDSAWCHVLKERYALVPAKADVPLATFPFEWDADVRVAVPPGLAFFKAEKSFSHGGAAVQELVIPHLASRSRTRAEKRIGVDVVVATTELTRAAVKVTLRPRLADSTPSGQLVLATEVGRTLALDVSRIDEHGQQASVLAAGVKQVRLEPEAGEQSITLFFHSAQALRADDILGLDVRDAETGEQFPAGGLNLTVARDM